ncbi:thiolase-like protein [Truncatella angustata]|uniref:beta-ketoacyl-[acyl-carrier-protein] synthase I n=1 Tax=Truncatella angustata TaxID=152316 RepID=A0A9P8UM02_9PEZI|nr:thiolase-like protein [Truncatella angustata]KAH6654643.1 thiolase-like protein [Truncatella angustata]
MRRVVVTGLGAITPLGVGVRRSWTRLLAGESGIVSVADFEPQNQWRHLPSTIAGIVPKGSTNEGRWDPHHWLTATEQRRTSTFAQYAMAATSEALEDAGWEPQRQEQLEATGVCLGSGIGNLDEIYNTSLTFNQSGYKKVSPLFVPKILINMAAGHIAMKYGFRGPNHAATTACTTGAHSIGDASRFIAFGDADVMVAGGSESCIHPLTFAGFGRSRSLSTAFNHDPRSSCRPFDRSRDGFVVAEGAAVMILEELEHAKARGAHIYAELNGYGCSGDAYQMTAPREDGSGAYRAMKMALRHGGIKPGEVDYINAHATGTSIGDTAEARAIQSLMVGPEGYAEDGEVAVSSTKGSIGHLLGAAGAIESVFSVLAITDNAIPPTMNLVEPDIEPKFNLVPLEAQSKKVNTAMSNSFGFGGTNASLVSCRRTLLRDLSTRHGGLVASSTDAQSLALARQLSRQQIVAAAAAASPSSTTPIQQQRRGFRTSAQRQQSWLKNLGSLIGRSVAEPYQVHAATETIYKAAAAEAAYTISETDKRNGTVKKTEEERKKRKRKTDMYSQTDFDLQPTFSTWSQITMLHLYLMYARLRNLPADSARSWQKQLTDHFFFDAEERMDVVHGLTSRGLRHRYLKDLFIQWRGVIAAYDEGVTKGDAVLAAAVWRNVYKGRADVDARNLAAITAYMRACLKSLDATPDQSLFFATASTFKLPARHEFRLVDLPARELEGVLPSSPTPPSSSQQPAQTFVSEAAPRIVKEAV